MFTESAVISATLLGAPTSRQLAIKKVSFKELDCFSFIESYCLVQ